MIKDRYGPPDGLTRRAYSLRDVVVYEARRAI
jgi:hypothetical protein